MISSQFKKNNWGRLVLIGIAIITFLFPLNVFADSSTDFTRSYGLMIHQGNRDKPVPQIKALEVLLKAFRIARPEVTGADFAFRNISPGSSHGRILSQACNLALLNCQKKAFQPYAHVSLRDFLGWFYRLRHIEDTPVREPHAQGWMEARQLNLLSGDEVTYKNLATFLYRYRVSESFFGQPYYEGLVFDPDEINSRQFSDLYQADEIRKRLFRHILELRRIEKRTEQEEDVFRRLNVFHKRFTDLQGRLEKARHPLNLLDDVPADIAESIKTLGLKEILAKFSYDYSRNEENRRHNLVLGTSKLNGKVYQPGETLDFINEIGDRQWWDYSWGWVISGGKKSWEFGGGLSGASTMIFIPSWRAGLEIVEHHAHSIYYTDLYPEDIIGLDATIYRPKTKNLRVRNNTKYPILFYVEDDTEKKMLSVYLIGNSPYRRIELKGPLAVDEKSFRWVRQMETFDGKLIRDEVQTTYNAIH